MTRATVTGLGFTKAVESAWLTPRELGERLVWEYERRGGIVVVEVRDVTDGNQSRPQ